MIDHKVIQKFYKSFRHEIYDLEIFLSAKEIIKTKRKKLKEILGENYENDFCSMYGFYVRNMRLGNKEESKNHKDVISYCVKQIHKYSNSYNFETTKCFSCKQKTSLSCAFGNHDISVHLCIFGCKYYFLEDNNEMFREKKQLIDATIFEFEKQVAQAKFYQKIQQEIIEKVCEDNFVIMDENTHIKEGVLYRYKNSNCGVEKNNGLFRVGTIEQIIKKQYCQILKNRKIVMKKLENYYWDEFKNK